MSHWTYVSGVVKVCPPGRTDIERRYILETILEHLPKVTGSEGGMQVHTIPCAEYSCAADYDEFGQPLPRGTHLYHHDEFLVVVEGSLRDREFDQTVYELNKWLCRLCKRTGCCEVLVRVRGLDKQYIFDNAQAYDTMYEAPSWTWNNQTGEQAWWEYLMWEPDPVDGRPLQHSYKFGHDTKVNKEMTRRRMWKERRKENYK